MTIITDPKLLYIVGKICAKANKKLEYGLMCLDDYKILLSYQKNYNMSSNTEKKLIMRKFWIAVIKVLIGQYE